MDFRCNGTVVSVATLKDAFPWWSGMVFRAAKAYKAEDLLRVSMPELESPNEKEEWNDKRPTLCLVLYPTMYGVKDRLKMHGLVSSEEDPFVICSYV